ncbi:MAG TPA: hypothetical protein VJW75_05780 [Candidatus Eisenbacteria bacterium]|nr:hypothetical protein [Candidatus Eisenbacteria bacterium]
MPNPDAFQPSLAPAEPSNLGIRRFLSTILGLVSVCAFLFAVWPGLLHAVWPDARLGRFGEDAPIRFVAIAIFVVTLTIRIRLSPGRQPKRQEIAWAAFANAIGGTLVEDQRKPTLGGWEGGAKVRWNAAGAAIELTAITDSSRNDQTRFQSDIRLSQGFQFYALPRSFLTAALASSALWSVILKGMKSEMARPQASGPEVSVPEQMAFMLEKEVVIGDPVIDAAVLVKSNDPSLARELFANAAVSHWLRELNAGRKGWQMSLVVRRVPDDYRLELTIPGVLSDPKTLDAARQVVEGALGSLAGRGLLDAPARKAAG